MPKIHDFDIGRGRNRDQTEGEINKIQIDKRAANDSFLIPHSSSHLFLSRESSTDLRLGAEGLPNANRDPFPRESISFLRRVLRQLNPSFNGVRAEDALDFIFADEARRGRGRKGRPKTYVLSLSLHIRATQRNPSKVFAVSSCLSLSLDRCLTPRAQ